MFQTLDIFRTSHAMARHAAKRQSVIAGNVANADTPGFRARDMDAFADSAAADPSRTMRATRSTHLNGRLPDALSEAHVDDGAEAAPNGNTVSLEEELMKGVAARRQHDQALAIYRSAVTMLRASLGRR